MPPFDEQAAHLPPPRADEPANLRREIIDELSDHLTCARKREQLAGGPQSDEAIRNRILDRFGDPAAVARKLWLDWMWEKIMTQRILTGVCILLAVLTCAALAFAWVSVNRQHDLIVELQMTSQTQLEQQQKQFEHLLADSQKSNAPSDWNPVELRFVKGKKDGPPAEGIKVVMSITAQGTGIPPVEATSNKQGVVRFERVRYGGYKLEFRNSANERYTFSTAIQPGESRTETILCPEVPTEPAQLTSRIIWPEDLAKRPLWFQIEPESVYRPVGGSRWRPPPIMIEEDGSYYPPVYNALFAPNAETARANQNVFGSASRRLRPEPNHWERHVVMHRSGRRGIGTERELFPKMPQGMRWPGSDYRIDKLEVFLSELPMASLEELNNPPAEPETVASGRGRFTSSLLRRLYFYGIPVNSANWSYRIEPGTPEKPGTLWLTPTAEEIEKVRNALAEIDRGALEAAEKRRAEMNKAREEAEKNRGESEQPVNRAADSAYKEITDTK